MIKILIFCLSLLGCATGLNAAPTGLNPQNNFETVIPSSEDGFSWQRLENGIQLRIDNQVKNILFYGPKTVRVNATLGTTHTEHPSLVVLTDPAAVDFTVQEANKQLIIKSAALSIRISETSGALTFLDADGTEFTHEAPHSPNSIKELTISGAPTYETEQRWIPADDESLYGLGQYNDRYMDYRGQEVNLVQTNIGIVVPFMVSTNNYGILWDTYSKMHFKDDDSGASLWAESSPNGVDYYFIAGDNMDEVIKGYRHLTGDAPMFPKQAFGLFMSKERYKTQEQLLDIARTFRKEQFPLDYIVQDWQYWGGVDGTWSGMIWDPERYPDPVGMCHELHDELNLKIMASIWPSIGIDTELDKELSAKGLNFSIKHWITGKGHIYDAYNPEARKVYFKHLKKGLLDVGIDALWMDGTEVEVDTAAHDPLESERGIKSLGSNYLGDFTRYLNPYSLVTTMGTYQGQRAISDQRVFTLTRSAWAGQQHYGAMPWSGDTTASWGTLRDQIAGGLNVILAGQAYWTQDTGAFFVPHPNGEQNPEYQELFARWNQFSIFNPIYRIHGTNIQREPWRFKDSAPKLYQSLLEAAQLRYRLLPYIYSLSWLNTSEGYSLMRALPMDFPDEMQLRKVDDSFMFGPSILVHPITRGMYHPSTPPPAAIPSSALRTPDGKQGLKVEYFKGMNFEQHASTLVETEVDHTWPGPPLAEPPAGLDSLNQFSARWEGFITAPEDGLYKIGLEGDDGYRLWLDGKLVLDEWRDQAPLLKTVKVELTQGQTLPVKIEYYQDASGRTLRLCWRTPKQQQELIAFMEHIDNLQDTYLPQGSDWYDFWTNEIHHGGETVSMACPLNQFPLYIRAGSIIPFGPVQQYATEKPDAPYEIRIYPGADADFTLYEDDNETYAYEQDQYATVDLHWNDTTHTLSIDQRQGGFPELVKERVFTLILVSSEASPAKSITYTGKATEIQF